jgi:ATP-dependent Lon protease
MPYEHHHAMLNSIHQIIPHLRKHCILTKESEIHLRTHLKNASSKQDLIQIVSQYGIYSFEECLRLFDIVVDDSPLLEVLLKYFHPLGVKITNTTTASKSVEVQNVPHKSFFMKCFGISVVISKNTVITGYIDNHFFSLEKYPFLNTCNNLVKKMFILKDYLLLSDPKQVDILYDTYTSQLEQIKTRSLGSIVKEFSSHDLFNKRTMLLKCLMDDATTTYAYFLFDLLSTDTGPVETIQNMLYESFPFEVQNEFIIAASLSETAAAASIDENKISLDKQIMMMKVPNYVKEKAFSKLKEIKNKSEESSSKCRQYIEGLLKIPFGIYRREPMLYICGKIQKHFKEGNWTLSEIWNYTELVLNTTNLRDVFCKLQEAGFIPRHSKYTKKLVYEHQATFLNLRKEIETIPQFMDSMTTTFNRAIYGHKEAKQVLKQIVAQMIHGNISQGYALGFEGPPGVGKTSLAKHGLSECLLDENGKKRPFYMIGLGGDVNGSSIQGHHYTYLGSIWGSIVQILMDAQCLNPIILFDEVDKVSKTENGKEIIGVLTHVLDATQNEFFQDKYFSGINIDLSKIIFILSYNDASQIDKILLDRVKRIPFKSLLADEKVLICKNYFLPEIMTNHKMQGKIVVSDETLRHIIDMYTYECGCRKLKELLTHIIAHINLDSLENLHKYQFPFELTIDDIDNIYLKTNFRVRQAEVKSGREHVGIINCLYANDYGQGGILKTVAKIIPSSSFLELKLTGLLDGMMKESFEVAKTVAWSLLDETTRTELRNKYNGEQKFGIHIHCGDGSISKSGTSAGVAITVLLYSIFKNLPIKTSFAITGEVTLDGAVNEIGALEYKFLGGIKAGVQQFLFPKENMKNYLDFLNNYKPAEKEKSILFHPVSSIDEVIDIIFK